MKKKIIISALIIISIGVLLLFISNKEELDETSAFLINLKEATQLDFGDVYDTELVWNELVIGGKGIEAKNMAYQQDEKIKEFFINQEFEEDDYNSSLGVLSRSFAFKKDSMVCILEVTVCDNCLDEDLSIIELKNDLVVKCGFLDESNVPLSLINKIKDLFAKKYPNIEFDVYVEEQSDKYIRGSIVFEEEQGGGFLLAEKEDQWQIVYDGNGVIPCEQIEEYDFPEDFVGECDYIQTIEVKQGEVFSLSAIMNMFSGYAWAIGYYEEEYIGFSPEDISISSLENNELEEIFKLTALKKGETKIKLFYTCCGAENIPIEERTYRIIID